MRRTGCFLVANGGVGTNRGYAISVDRGAGPGGDGAAGAGRAERAAAQRGEVAAAGGGDLSSCIGRAGAGAAVLTGVLGRGKVADLAPTPWWVWAGGGLLGAVAVTAALIEIPKVSAGVVIAATVFGELVAAVVIDHFGWLGVPQVRLNPWRIAGAVLAVRGRADDAEKVSTTPAFNVRQMRAFKAISTA